MWIKTRELGMPRPGYDEMCRYIYIFPVGRWDVAGLMGGLGYFGAVVVDENTGRGARVVWVGDGVNI